MRTARAAAAATAAAAAAATLSSARPRHAASAADDDVRAAVQLREAALRARAVLSDPPQMLQRCARSAWRQHAGVTAMDELARRQAALSDSLASAANSWKERQGVRPAELRSLTEAVSDTEAAVRGARASAVRAAAAVPWGEVLGSSRLEPATGSAAADAPGAEERLRGRVVGLYFTASWCGPCRRFTPKLVQLYEAAAAARAPDGLELVLVSWDEIGDERREYARQAGMRWLALPHSREARALADELTLRYDVTSIPALVVVEVSADGSSARVLSRDGRMDVERGHAPWMSRVLG